MIYDIWFCTMSYFRRLLKTHYFSLDFNICYLLFRLTYAFEYSYVHSVLGVLQMLMMRMMVMMMMMMIIIIIIIIIIGFYVFFLKFLQLFGLKFDSVQ